MDNISNYTKGKISKLAKIFFSKEAYPKNGTQFIASLYILKPNANEKIAQDLRSLPGLLDLHSIYSKDEISFLLDHFEYIFRKYCDYLGDSSFIIEPKDLDNCIMSIFEISNNQTSTSTFIPHIGENYIINNSLQGNVEIMGHHPLLDIAVEEFGTKPAIKVQDPDFIESSISSGKKFKNIVSIQFFFADPDNMDLTCYGDGYAYELIDMLKGMLDNGGQMAILIKETACFGRDLKKFRQFLVENSNLYKTSVLRIPISNTPQKVCACLVLVEKVTASAYHRPICLGNLDHAAFKIVKGKDSFILNSKEIVTAVRNEDPQYFIKVNTTDLKDGYDLMPTHYTIDEGYRLKTLVDSFVSKAFINKDRSTKNLIASLYSLIEGRDQQYYDILKPFVRDLSDRFSESNIQFLVKRFEKVVEYCYTNDSLFGEDEGLTKDYMDVVKTLCKDYWANSRSVRALLPFGDIRLATMAPMPLHLHLCEQSKTDWAISNIVKEALELDGKIIFGDIVKNESIQYRYIIARPRFEQKNITETTQIIIDCIDSKLEDGGTMAILLPREACYGAEWLDFRRYITIGRDDIHVGIISLRIPSATTINEECLCIVEKSRGSNSYTGDNRVVLMDADKEDFLLSNPEVGYYGLKVKSIIEAIEKHDENSVIAVSPNNLDRGLNLLAARYLRFHAIPRSKAVHGRVVHLREVIRIIPRIKQTWTDIERAGDRIISHLNLSDNYLPRIKPELVDFLPSKEVNYTTANGGYVAFTGGKILVGKIIGESEDQQIGIDDTVSHFSVDSNVTSLDYILKVISEEDYVLKQVKCLTKGYTWTDGFLHLEDLLEIRIVLPSLEEQNRELLEDSKRGYEDKSAEVQKNFDVFRTNMHMQKHKIGQTIGALSTWINLVNYARQMGNGIVDDSAIIVPEYNTSAKEIFEKLTRTAAKLQREIEVLDSSYGIEKDIEDIALADFLDEYIEGNVWSGFDIIWDSHKHRHAKDFKMVEFDKDSMDFVDAFIKEGDPIEYIRCTYQGLETILDNIIANARSHGFKKKDKRYQIKFDIEADFEQVVLYVSNNGEPMHKQMESSDVYAYGHSSDLDNHSGIGCYQIKDYMDTLKGKVEIISTPDDEFTVTYKLTFVNATPSRLKHIKI